MYPIKAERIDTRKTKLDLSHKKRIVQLHCRKKKWKEISSLTGISEHKVGEIIHRYHKGRPNNWVLTERQESLVVKMYKAGYGGPTIAKYFGWDIDVVYRILKRKNVQRREYTHYREYDMNQDFFEIIDTEEKAYWLGFLLADGCIKENRQVLLRLAKKDKGHLEKIQKSISSQYPYFYADQNNTVGISIGSKKMCRDLSNHGCVMNKTFLIYYPDIPSELDRHFIRGYFDGDGSFSYNPISKSSSFGICGKKEFLLDIQLRMIDYVGLNKTKIIKTKSIHALRYGGRKQVLRILNWLYNDSTIYLDRKYQRYVSFKNDYIGAELKLGELLEHPNG